MDIVSNVLVPFIIMIMKIIILYVRHGKNGIMKREGEGYIFQQIQMLSGGKMNM